MPNKTIQRETVFGATGLSRRSGVSRATVYRYMNDYFFFEPAGKNPKGAFFTMEHVSIVEVIQRLNKVHRFRLAEIREQIIPEFSQAELAATNQLTDEKLAAVLRRRGITFRPG